MECDSCAIKNLVYEYARLIDSGDLKGVAALFARGKVLVTGPGGSEEEVVGAEAVHRLYRAFTRLYEDDGTPHTLHMTSNVMVEIEEEGVLASASSCAIVFQAVPELPLQPIIGVRYHDTFTKGEGGWYFTARRIETVLTGDLSRHLLR